MGERKQKRSRAQCVHVYRLVKSGMTHKQVAELIGKKPESIAGMVKVGERWSNDTQR